MSKIRQRLIDQLSARLGADATPDQVICELYRLGALDDVLATHGLIRDDFEQQMASTAAPRCKIVMGIAMSYSRSEQGVDYIIRKGGLKV